MFKYKKRLSQNFLIDNNIKNNILQKFNITNKKIVIEIGPGNGSITQHLAKMSSKMFLIEIDNTLISELKTQFKDNANIFIYHDDILKFNLNKLFNLYSDIRIFGNIPYKISTKIILLLLKYITYIYDIHLIVQDDIYKRLNCENKTYSFLQLIILYNFEIKYFFTIKPTSFFPAPKILSCFIRLKPKKNKTYILNYNYFKYFLKFFFKNKRKKIYKSVLQLIYLNKYFDLNERPESFSLNEYIRLFNLIYISKID